MFCSGKSIELFCLKVCASETIACFNLVAEFALSSLSLFETLLASGSTSGGSMRGTYSVICQKVVENLWRNY